jgi:hypothetical protein
MTPYSEIFHFCLIQSSFEKANLVIKSMDTNSNIGVLVSLVRKVENKYTFIKLILHTEGVNGPEEANHFRSLMHHGDTGRKVQSTKESFTL